MDDLTREILAAGEAEVPDEKNLSKMSLYVNELKTLERQMEEHDLQGIALRNRYNTIAGGYVSTQKTTVTGLLPALMKECGVPAFDFGPDDARESVSIKQVYMGSISEAHSVEAFKWLRDNKFGALIKNLFKVSLGVGDDKKAAKLVKALEKAELPYEQKESVHSATLSAFIREQTEAGKDLPTDLLGVFVYEAAQIKTPKKKKAKGPKYEEQD